MRDSRTLSVVTPFQQLRLLRFLPHNFIDKSLQLVFVNKARDGLIIHLCVVHQLDFFALILLLQLLSE